MIDSPPFAVWAVAAVLLHAGVAVAVTVHAPSWPTVERVGTTPQEAIIEEPAPDLVKIEDEENVTPPEQTTLTHLEMHELNIPHTHRTAPAAPASAPDHDHDHDATQSGPHAAAAAAVETAAPEAAPVHFTMSLGGAAITTGGPVSSQASAPAAAVETVPESSVTEPAKLVSDVKPAYPPDARREGIEVDVPLEIVVDASGAVVEAHVTRRAGFGFDESALSAARRWRFSPARRDGKLVRVRMRWPVQFRLQ